MKNNISIFILFLIVTLSIVLRFYKLDIFPASLNWDEVAAGYNAYTIANWGADEYGTKFPLVFTSFGDDKHPVHIYFTSLIVKVFGLSDYVTRSGSALIAVLAVISIYFLSKELFKDEAASLFASLFLAISPYSLHYSRGLWEANFAISLFIIGLTIFYIGIRKQNYFIPLSFVFFGLSFFSYHSAKIVIPVVVLLISLISIKKLLSNKKNLTISIVVALVFLSLVIKDPKILGFARMNQTSFSSDTLNKYGGKLNTYIHNYKSYFTYSYLFKSGDQNPRGSVKVVGEFYKIDMIFSVLGIIALLFYKKWKTLITILSILLIAPIPGAVSTTEPNSTRGIFMLLPIILLSAFGASSILAIFKNKWLKAIVLILILVVLGFETYNYLNYYYTSYSKKEAIEWQYGMKQIVEFSKKNPDYYKIYVDKVRQQPYIFFLYYLQTPLPELLSTVKYDQSESKSFNTVLSFGRYQFGGWDIIDSYPNSSILYAITPSYYGGLRYLDQFNVMKLIKYPNKSDAFYIISGNE